MNLKYKLWQKEEVEEECNFYIILGVGRYKGLKRESRPKKLYFKSHSGGCIRKIAVDR